MLKEIPWWMTDASVYVKEKKNTMNGKQKWFLKKCRKKI
jgi:hypothetical protein